ncbi:FeoA family protein [Leptospira idonii]|uniref:Ferrous iron transport protein A n=1 Tax=Leptospira idonii TaxID=1193500 RepID=A0A4R9M3S3_9LEPT|nr:FeoA family protein [Leptospira idonii]TGN20762.1 ferrous iron transport protein A [Leptospira idonii]
MKSSFPGLDLLKENSFGEIVSFDSQTPSHFLTELLELGFFPGAKLRILNTVPSQNKMIVLIGGSKVGLRLSDCKFILVKEEIIPSTT